MTHLRESEPHGEHVERVRALRYGGELELEVALGCGLLPIPRRAPVVVVPLGHHEERRPLLHDPARTALVQNDAHVRRVDDPIPKLHSPPKKRGPFACGTSEQERHERDEKQQARAVVTHGAAQSEQAAPREQADRPSDLPSRTISRPS